MTTRSAGGCLEIAERCISRGESYARRGLRHMADGEFSVSLHWCGRALAASAWGDSRIRAEVLATIDDARRLSVENRRARESAAAV